MIFISLDELINAAYNLFLFTLIIALIILGLIIASLIIYFPFLVFTTDLLFVSKSMYLNNQWCFPVLCFIFILDAIIFAILINAYVYKYSDNPLDYKDETNCGVLIGILMIGSLIYITGKERWDPEFWWRESIKASKTRHLLEAESFTERSYTLIAKNKNSNINSFINESRILENMKILKTKYGESLELIENVLQFDKTKNVGTQNYALTILSVLDEGNPVISAEGALDQALELLDAAFRSDSLNYNTEMLYGIIQGKLFCNYKSSNELLGDALIKIPPENTSLLAIINFNMGINYFILNNFGEAKKEFLIASAFDSSYTAANAYLAYINKIEGNTEVAKQYKIKYWKQGLLYINKLENQLEEISKGLTRIGERKRFAEKRNKIEKMIEYLKKEGY